MLETLAEDHIRTFRAYGVSERAIVGRHALRGALAPVIALNAIDLGTMFGGAVLTETLFGLPGHRPAAGPRRSTSSTCRWWSASCW